MKVDLKRRLAHEDGWMITGKDGRPWEGSWRRTRKEARWIAQAMEVPSLSIVRDRNIIAWRKP